MAQNIYSLGLLRNGKVYQNKDLAIQGLTQAATNDGVAKLARYLEPIVGSDPIIRTMVGFYANASEMNDAGGGQSSYTILDIDGTASDVSSLKEEVGEISNIIGDGIASKTLTEAINEINETLGSGFTTAHTVTEVLEELKTLLTDALTISITVASDPGEYAKVYEINQGGNLIGTIDIPKDIIIKEGKLVFGKWEGDEFLENTEEHHYGDEPAIKLVLNNDNVIYINAQDLVDVYTSGNGITIVNNEISVKLDESGEAFLTVGENGLKLYGVQTAIDNAIAAVKLEEGDGISITSQKINAVAAQYSAPDINNPISVDEDGIKFSSLLDCGFF